MSTQFNKPLFIGIAVLVALQACRPKPIDIKVEPAKTKLCVASRIVPNRIMLVSLTRSFSSLVNKQNGDSVTANFLQNVLVKNALVTVAYQGKTDTLFKITDGVYGSINTLLTNYSDYSLKVKDLETGLEIDATTMMLPYVAFNNVKPYKTVSGKDTTCSIKWSLSDNTTVENYYVVNYVKKLNQQNNTTIDLNRLFSNGSVTFETEFELYNDKSFTNGELSVDHILKGVSPRDSIAISVANISKGYYEFLSAFKRSGSFLSTLVGEPISYPSNVKNGYGYFNAHFPQILMFDMKNQ